MGSSSARVRAILELIDQLNDGERDELDAELYPPDEGLNEDELDAELVRRASEAVNDPASTEAVEDVIERKRMLTRSNRCSSTRRHLGVAWTDTGHEGGRPSPTRAGIFSERSQSTRWLLYRSIIAGCEVTSIASMGREKTIESSKELCGIIEHHVVPRAFEHDDFVLSDRRKLVANHLFVFGPGVFRNVLGAQ
jgi:hypothetical protein